MSDLRHTLRSLRFSWQVLQLQDSNWHGNHSIRQLGVILHWTWVVRMRIAVNSQLKADRSVCRTGCFSLPLTDPLFVSSAPILWRIALTLHLELSVISDLLIYIDLHFRYCPGPHIISLVFNAFYNILYIYILNLQNHYPIKPKFVLHLSSELISYSGCAPSWRPAGRKASLVAHSHLRGPWIRHTGRYWYSYSSISCTLVWYGFSMFFMSPRAFDLSMQVCEILRYRAVDKTLFIKSGCMDNITFKLSLCTLCLSIATPIVQYVSIRENIWTNMKE